MVRSLISWLCDSLFPIKTEKRLIEFLIINKTAREYVQNTDLVITLGSSQLSIKSTLATKVAATNSSLGMDTVSKG